MKTRKNKKYLIKQNHNFRKYKKGGFLFGSPKVVSSNDCDINNLS